MSTPDDRIRQITTPAEHFGAIASDPRFTVIAWKAQAAEKAWLTLSADATNIPSALNELAGGQDMYVTPNEFFGWRKTNLLAALNAFYIDLDAHEEGVEIDPIGMVHGALEKLEAARLPLPNFVVYTGRGAHLYWCFEKAAPRMALPRWTAVAKHLTVLLEGDKKCSECTRVLRLVGSQNSKAQTIRQSVTAEVINPERYNFDWLCDQIFDVPRARLRDIDACRALREVADGESPKTKANRKKAAIGLHEVARKRYHDLLTIMKELYWFGGVPVGLRNNYLYHCAINLSWFLYPQSLEAEIIALAEKYISLAPREIVNYTKPVILRAHRAFAGESVHWDGKYKDPRYCYSRQSLWAEFGNEILSMPGLIDKMQAILPDDVMQDRQRSLKRRRSQDHYTGDGVRESNREKLAQALEMAAQGHSNRQIGIALEVSDKTVGKWVADLRRK